MAYPNLRDEILSYVYNYSEEHGYAPSYREICQALGVKSKSTVQNHIRRLEAEGRLCFRTKRPRTMVERRQASVTVSDTQRLRLKIADGGEVLVDCDVTGAGSGGAPPVPMGPGEAEAHTIRLIMSFYTVLHLILFDF